jgi:acyl dehydratase
MNDSEKNNDEKPDLVFADLETGRAFRPLNYPVTRGLVADYMATVGDENPLYSDSEAARAAGMEGAFAPPGLAAIYSRLSYLQDHNMPSGGVLAKQEFEFHRPIPLDENLTVTARVAESYVDKKDRRRVNFLIEAKDYRGDMVSTTRLYAIWPK